VHVDWLASDDVTSSAVFTLQESEFVDLNSSTAASCIYVNSSEVVLVAQVSRLSAGGTFMSLVQALAASSPNYTFVSYRPQYGDDQQMQHYVHIVVERSSAESVMMDGSVLNVTTDWATVCGTDGRLLSTVVRTDPGSHWLYTVDVRPLSGTAHGNSNRSAYGCALASMSDGSGLWTADYLWREHVQTTTSSTTTSTAHVTTVTSARPQTAPVTTETLGIYPPTAADDDNITLSPTSSDTVRSVTTSYVEVSDIWTTGSVLNRTSVVVYTDSVTSAARETSHEQSATECCQSSAVASTSNTPPSTDGPQTLASNNSATSTERTITEVTSYGQRTDENRIPPASLTTGVKQSSLTSTAVGTTLSAVTSSSSRVERDSTTAASSAMIHNATRRRQTEDGGADGVRLFEVFKMVCIYGGLSLFCALLVAWFFCSQTALLKRAGRRRVNAAAGDHVTSLSRDRAPVSENVTLGQCGGVVLGESTDGSSGGSSLSRPLDSRWNIAPLVPAYFNSTPVGLSLDESCLLQAGAKPTTLAHVTRSVDVDLLRQLADCRRDAVNLANVHCDKFACSDRRAIVNVAAADDRLYVETLQRRQSQQQPKHLISLPHA